MLHRLYHWLGFNRGTVVAATDDRGHIWIAFKCSACGKLTGTHISPENAPKPPADEQFT